MFDVLDLVSVSSVVLYLGLVLGWHSHRRFAKSRTASLSITTERDGGSVTWTYDGPVTGIPDALAARDRVTGSSAGGVDHE